MNPTKTGVELRCSGRCKKNLKILKELSESVNRRTDNTMEENPQKNNDLQNTTQKTNDQAPWTPQKPGLSSDALEEVRRVWRYQSGNQICKSKDKTIQWEKKPTKTMIYKLLHRKLNDQAPSTPQKLVLSSDVLEDVRRVWRY